MDFSYSFCHKDHFIRGSDPQIFHKITDIKVIRCFEFKFTKVAKALRGAKVECHVGLVVIGQRPRRGQ